MNSVSVLLNDIGVAERHHGRHSDRSYGGKEGNNWLDLHLLLAEFYFDREATVVSQCIKTMITARFPCAFQIVSLRCAVTG